MKKNSIRRKIKKIFIIKKKQEFKLIVSNPTTTLNNPIYRVYVLNTKENAVGFGIAVNKKNFKLAVTRNKIKRQVREIVRAIANIKSVKMVIVVKSAYINNTFEANKKMFYNLYNVI